MLGLWPLLPIGVYLLCRGRSRFVAHHAVRAALLQLGAGVLCLAGYAIAVLIVTAATSLLPEIGAVIVSLLVALGYGCLIAWYLVVAVNAMIGACRGRRNPRAPFARTAERLLAYDAGVPPPV